MTIFSNIKNLVESRAERIRSLGRAVSFALYTFIFALSALLSSCSETTLEEPDNNTVTPDPENVSSYYLTLNITNPASSNTRADSSYTDNDGDSNEEPLAGTTDETSLVSAHIYFCKDNKIIADFEADYIEPMNDSQTTIRVELTDNLNDLLGLAGGKAQIFVVGNTKNGNSTVFSPSIPADKDLSKATFPISAVNASPIGSFGTAGKIMPLMNAEVFEVTITKADGQSPLDAIKNMFSRHTPTIAWWDVAGTLKLERGVARLEYKDKTDERDGEQLPRTPHVYEIPNVGTTENHLQIQLYSLEPFNINTKSYLLRHTTKGNYAEGDKNEITIFGKERDSSNPDLYDGISDGYSWVASPWWTESAIGLTHKLSIDSDKSEYVLEGAGTAETLIENIDGCTTMFVPFYYVSENTLNSVDLMTEEEVIKYATGVMFKFLVLDGDGNAFKFKTDGSGYPYYIANSKETNGAIDIMDNDGKWVELTPDTEGNYYLKYIGIIVHNAGTQKAEGKNFAPMYYGVVRNNTYQMTVKGVEGLPIPRDPKTLYLQLDINVLPWNVRQNDFTF